MKCPKCGYVGYQEVARCRNCGYDFSLADDAPTELALPLRGDDTPGPMADLSLTRTPAPGPVMPPAAAGGPRPTPQAPAGQEARASSSSTAVARPPAPAASVAGAPTEDGAAGLAVVPAAARDTEDALPGVDAPLHGDAPAAIADAEWLPLFGNADEPDDPPLVRGPLTPRAPLAVRRTTADLQRTRTRTPRTVRRSERSLLPGVDEHPAEMPARVGAGDAGRASGPAVGATAAGAFARAAAAIIDLALVLAIDGSVFYFTLQIAGLRPDEWQSIPKGPFLAFLLLLDGGYLVTFTVAGGQTLGKMAAGLRVIGVTGPVDLGRSLARAAGCLLTLATGGLGFLPALVASDGRAVHDRLAGTRVVRQP